MASSPSCCGDPLNPPGQHWTRAVSETPTVDRRLTDGMFLGFQTATVGRWIGDPSTIWTTTDAGDHWIPHRFRGP